MATKEELLAEAYRRNLLTGEKKAAYEEAMRRGLVPGGKPASGASPSVVQDMVSGAAQPWVDAWNTAKAGVQEKVARAASPPKLSQVPGMMVGDLARDAGFAGQLLGLIPNTVTQGAVRPVARAVNRATAGVPLYEAPRMTDYAGMAVNAARGGPAYSPRELNADERQTAIEGNINTALSAAKPASARYPTAPKPAPVDVQNLRQMKTDAYAAVDNAGIKFVPQETDAMIDGMRQTLAASGVDPVLNPKAARTMDLLEQRKGSTMSLSDVEDLRKIVRREVLSSKEGGDQFFGGLMRDSIDQFIDGVTPAQLINPASTQNAAELVGAAREANRRYRNVKEVMDRTESADLRASSTYAGGNHANATRQNLRPLIDPKSPQRLKGLSADETKALNDVVRGTPGQNAMRVMGKVLDPRGLLGATVQTVLGLPTSGAASAVSIPAGIAASEMSNAMTAGAVKKAIDVLATGGATKRTPLPPPVIGKVPLLSVPGAIGAGVTAAPLTRSPSGRFAKSIGSKERPAPPKKQRARG